MAAAEPSSSFDFKVAIAALAGSTAALGFAKSLDFVDVATSMNGGAGAAIGYVIGDMMKPSLLKSETETIQKLADYTGVIGAFAVPAIVDPGLMGNAAILAAGAYIGVYLVNKMNEKTA